MRAPGSSSMYKQCSILRKRTGSYVLPDTPPDQYFQLLFLHQENEEILLPPVRAVRLRYRHRRIVEAIPRYCSKETHQKRSAFQRGHGLQLRNKRGNRIFQACVKCCAICFGNEPRNDGNVKKHKARLVSKKSDCKYFCK